MKLCRTENGQYNPQQIEEDQHDGHKDTQTAKTETITRYVIE